jgi:SAM-dependent methyltransferase
MVFSYYAKYYNLLYRDKNYKAESEYVHGLIRKFAIRNSSSLLDIGCGTGTHVEHFVDLGYEVTGIDRSAKMIDQAISKNIRNASFRLDNATSFTLDQNFDVVTSLFHVLSYQTNNSDVLSMFDKASKHLNDNGLFIFDFWYGPAVLTERPSVKIKRLEDDATKVTRISEPHLHINENIVDVNFELIIEEKGSDKTQVIHEVHHMRYFFKPEIELLLKQTGFRLVSFIEWLTDKAPSERSLGVCCVALKS